MTQDRMQQELERLKSELAKGTQELQTLDQRRAMLAQTLEHIRGAIMLGEQSLTWDAPPTAGLPNGSQVQLADVTN